MGLLIRSQVPEIRGRSFGGKSQNQPTGQQPSFFFSLAGDPTRATATPMLQPIRRCAYYQHRQSTPCSLFFFGVDIFFLDRIASF
jgi:hypothetical protein